MRIDLHTHTLTGSECSHVLLAELVADARAAGVDAICVTDHDGIAVVDEADVLAERVGFPIFVGVEISALEGHILCYGYRSDVSFAVGRSVAEFAPRLLAGGAALVAAHPIRPGWPRRIADDPSRFAPWLAAWEGFNGNCDPATAAETWEIARSAGIRLTGGSDAHTVGRAGWAWTEFDRDILNGSELARALIDGGFRPGCADPDIVAAAHGGIGTR